MYDLKIDINVQDIFLNEHSKFDMFSQTPEKIERRCNLFLKIMGDQVRVEVISGNKEKVKEIIKSFLEFMSILHLASQVVLDNEVKEIFEI